MSINALDRPDLLVLSHHDGLGAIVHLSDAGHRSFAHMLYISVIGA